jgi:hypothetical protein
MQPFAAAYLTVARSVARAGTAEVYAFSASLARLTPALARRGPDEALRLAEARAVDRFGGTRIATAVRALLTDRHAAGCRGAVVLVASDGWDGDDPALLRDAMAPNLVQTLAGSPALVHGGPFANIAHGCNSVVATRLGLSLADVVITEAGFGADLGAEKFCDIKCRAGGLTPAACVVVATVRALKMHGGVAKKDLGREDLGALRAGLPNLLRHVENMRKFGLPVVVALNRFSGDTEAETALVREALSALGAEAVPCTHWADGAAGAAALAEAEERPGTLAEALDQAGLGEKPQMARNARLRLAQDGGEVGDRQLGFAQEREDAQPRRFRCRPQGCVEIGKGERLGRHVGIHPTSGRKIQRHWTFR